MRIAPARSGWKWLAEGLRLFRASPGRWTLLVVAYWMLIAIVNRIDYLGSFVVAICLPGFSASFMVVCEELQRGRPLHLAMLFAGFRERLPAQIVLGVVYLASLALVIGGSALADDGMLARWLLTGHRPAETDAEGDALLGALALSAALYAPVMAMFWFAPLLAAWHGMAPVKALFYSFFACLMNWRAFLAYGAAVGVVLFLLPSALLLVLVLLSGGTLRLQPMALVLPLALIMLPTLFASFFASYRDVFAVAPAQEAG